MDYLHDMIAILRGLAMLECEVRDIQTSLLVGIVLWSSHLLLATYCQYHQVLIEAAHQRKLTQDIHESQDILDGAVHL
jgi:hypothetical protein